MEMHAEVPQALVEQKSFHGIICPKRHRSEPDSEELMSQQLLTAGADVASRDKSADAVLEFVWKL